MTTDELVGKLIDLGGRLHVGDMEVLSEAAVRIRRMEQTIDIQGYEKPQFPLQLSEWDIFWQPFSGPQKVRPGEAGVWILAIYPEGAAWARRRTRAEMETLSGER